MEQSAINHLDSFFEDVGFPIDKHGLLQESFDSPLPDNVREAIALLPDREYTSREDVKRELIDIPFDDETPKKDLDAMELEDVDDKPDEIVDLDEFTQMGDEQNQEEV